MWYILSKKLRRELIHWPESGPGYQIVLFSDQKFQGSFIAIVFNGTYYIKFDNYYNDSIEAFFVEVIKGGREIKNALTAENLFITKVLPPVKATTHADGNTGKQIFCSGEEMYLRKSFFRFDCRFDIQNRCLYPGSFLYKHDDSTIEKRNNFQYQGKVIYPKWMKHQWGFDVLPTQRDRYCENYQGIDEEFKFFFGGTKRNTLAWSKVGLRPSVEV
ncbi:MAG: hypothetical protein CL840_08355 [Crocinitomicaceae bacterium]|nr:hypothetical protein [Crocinitomicaceae bacterium]|tara:strand:+ start:617 stop:1264 length:648 start_codon:yes stop_codon:yes gene_type:complete